MPLPELIDDFLAKLGGKNKRESSAAENRRLLKKDVEPERGNRKAKDITRRHVRKLLDGILARNGPTRASSILPRLI
jgi:hypothetical protein